MDAGATPGLAVLRIAEAYKRYVKRPYGSSITQAKDDGGVSLPFQCSNGTNRQEKRLGLAAATWNAFCSVFDPIDH